MLCHILLSEKVIFEQLSLKYCLFLFLTGSQVTHNILRNNSNDLFSEASLSSSCNNSPATGCAQIDINTIFGDVPNYNSPENVKGYEILDAACKHIPLSMDTQKERWIYNAIILAWKSQKKYVIIVICQK